MAYAGLVSLAQTIDLILNYHQHSISPQVKNQIISIDKYAIFLQAFLEDFPDKANSLEGRIREVTREAEDITEFLYASLESTARPSKSKSKDQQGGMRKQIQSRCAVFKSTVGSSKSVLEHQPREKHEQLRYGCHELKRVTEEIESIAEKVMQIKISITVKDARIGDFAAPSSSSRVAPIHKNAMVGFDDDLMEIKSRLCRDSSKLEVVPIVGMGGIGKTTLARNVYDDPLIMEYFQIRVWVTVSQDYSARDIVSSLLVSIEELLPKNASTIEHQGDAEKESIKAQKVYQNLKGRRYLIVLDDLWSTKAWDDLKMMLPDDGNGSRIMLTTRLLDVASYPDSSSPVHEMCLVNDDQSWNLLRQRVFNQEPCPMELEDIGKVIARSCKGLPLAIVVISGILSTIDRTTTAWENIAKNVMSAISANDKQFDEILSLSYTHLPHHLRPCFLYMGGLPEDHEMRVSKLIKLWVAEGFLRPNGSNKSFEETAEEYLEDLVKRNLVLATMRKTNGRIKCVGIHDLMREMCIRKAQEEDFCLHLHEFLQEGTKLPRRVSITRLDLNFAENVNGSAVRTILCWKHRQECMRGSLLYFGLLRIFNLEISFDDFFRQPKALLTSLPAEVFELFHLRYLAFDYPVTIPAAISNLQNLQTLLISSSKEWRYRACKPIFVPLPLEIWRMQQLRHLVLFCRLRPFQEGATFALENLQTLSLARNFICTREILKMIPNLKKLGISYDEEMCAADCQLHNLGYLQRLEILNLRIYKYFPCQKKVNPVFPRTLKKLTLSGLQLRWRDMKTVGSLPNLQVLKLRDEAYVGKKWVTTEGEFSQLNFLLIDGLELQHWITESSHFPRLKRLVLRRCWYLTEIPDGIGEIPTLELIDVDGRNKSLMELAKQIQEDQQSGGDNALQIRCMEAIV